MKPNFPVVQSGHPLNRGLVGAWLYTESGGNTTYDSSGYNNFGTITSASWAAGRAGPALTFASGNFVNVPTSSYFNFIPGTWSFWFKTTQTGINQGMLQRADTSGSNNGIVVFVNTSNQLNISIKGGGQTTGPAGGKVVTDGLWHHGAITFLQSGTEYLYLDGIMVGTNTRSVAWSFTANSIRMGRVNDTFWSPFVGSLDDIRIFNRGLTSEEINLLYRTDYTEFGQGFTPKQEFSNYVAQTFNLTVTDTAPLTDILTSIDPPVWDWDEQHKPHISPFHRLEQVFDPPIAQKLNVVNVAGVGGNGVSSLTTTLTAAGTNNIIVAVYCADPISVHINSFTAGTLNFQRYIGHFTSTVCSFEIWWALAPSPLVAQTIRANLSGTTDGISGGILYTFAVSGCYTAWPWDNRVFAWQQSNQPSFNVSTYNPDDLLIMAGNGFGGRLSVAPSGMSMLASGSTGNTGLGVATGIVSGLQTNRTITAGNSFGNGQGFMVALTVEPSLKPYYADFDSQPPQPQRALFHRLAQYSDPDGWPFTNGIFSAPPAGMRRSLRIR